MKNQQIAKIFTEIAELLELKEENIFRVRAYRRAAQNIDGLPRDVAALSEEELAAIPGIGKDLTGKIHEYLATGKIAKHEELKKEVPAGVLELLRVPGLGPKTAKLLYEKKKITGIEELEAATRAGNLAGLPGIQKKTEENILQGIERIKRGSERRPLGRVLPLAEDIVRRVRGGAPVGQIAVAGSIRRWKETVNDIDILCTSRQPEEVMETFVKLPHVSRILAQGPTKSSIIAEDGIQVDLRVVEEDSFGTALQYFTGNKQHNIKLRERAVRAGLKINEYGVFTEPEEKKIGGKKEADVYKALKLPFVPPELREDTGEIEAAEKGTLPDLVAIGDIKGDLHVHTKWSDGSHDLDAVVEAARKRGYRYIAITDHSKGLGIAHGLDEARLAEQINLIDETNRRHADFAILKGTEVDIRSDGRLDLSDDALAALDIVVASIHSGFKQPREQITKRLLSAIRNPCVSVIAHPTGRLIGERDAYDVDLEAVLKEAARYGVAMEINAYPLRLDLNDAQVKLAKEYALSFVIGTDTHVISQYDFMIYGVSVARRGWLEQKDILNTLEYGQLIRRLKSCRAGKAQRAK
ncbi:MAG: DNA polymerase/3'-5' exonuclease PolX [Deltaproteobacteria bacterium]|nr:DNA polymerase/3'-5' exonuclease PolX [Deltaproteobacteria bacterium]